MEFDSDKIKDIPRFLVQRAFWVTLILIGIAVLLGLTCGYKYVYLVKQSRPETPTLIRLHRSQLQEVLDQLGKRDSEFEQIDPSPYNLFEPD